MKKTMAKVFEIKANVSREKEIRIVSAATLDTKLADVCKEFHISMLAVTDCKVSAEMPLAEAIAWADMRMDALGIGNRTFLPDNFPGLIG